MLPVPGVGVPVIGSACSSRPGGAGVLYFTWTFLLIGGRLPGPRTCQRPGLFFFSRSFDRGQVSLQAEDDRSAFCLSFPLPRA